MPSSQIMLPPPAPAAVVRNVSTMYETLVGFIPIRGFRSASHHVEARVSKWATSSTETEEEAEGDAFRGEMTAEVVEKGRDALPLP